MKVATLKDKIFNSLEWIFFILLGAVAIWISYGVLVHFNSRKSSFSIAEEPISDYPVIGIVFSQKASEVKLDNVEMYYQIRGMSGLKKLEIGKNSLSNQKYDETDIVLLESFKHYEELRSYRIIHLTPILEKNRERVYIQVLHNPLNKSNSIFSDMVNFYLTSLKNSPGFIYNIWRDGKPMDVVLSKNTYSDYNIQPQQYKFLSGKCQEESFYECIALKLDKNEFKDCSNKCMPNVFSNLGINFTTPFCQPDDDDDENEYCALKIGKKIIDENNYSCKKSCSNLEYS